MSELNYTDSASPVEPMGTNRTPGGPPGLPPRPRCLPIFPPSNIFFTQLSTAELVLVCICAAVTLLVFVSFLEKVMYMCRQNQTSKRIRNQSLGILSIYPIVCTSAFLSICFPRATIVCSFVQSIAIARCLMTFMSMVMQYVDGPSGLETRLRNQRINLRSPPLCCCCFCLPQLKVNRKSIRFLRVLTLQYAISAPTITFISLVLFMDGRYHVGKMSLTNSYTYLDTLESLSALLALYSYIMFFRLCRDSLRLIKIVPKFFTLQLVILFVNLQGLVFNILAMNGIPPCERGMGPGLRAKTYHNMLLVCEMLLLSVLARRAYQYPSEGLDATDLSVSVSGGSVTSKRTSDPEVKGNGDFKKGLDEKPLVEDHKGNPQRDSFIFIDPIAKFSLADCRESDI